MTTTDGAAFSNTDAKESLSCLKALGPPATGVCA